MCFSAEASFGVRALLVIGGIATLKQAKSSTLKPFALIPFLFGVQQFTEGILWLSLTKAEFADFHIPTTYFFLVFAQIVWPAWVPFAFWFMEKNENRKKILKAIMILGFLVSAYLSYCIILFPIDSVISGHHIRYDLDYQHDAIRYSGIFYFIPTVIPALISTRKNAFLFGIIILTSFLLSKIYFEEYVVSVWCYFAAVLSILIFFLIRGFKQNEVNNEIKNKNSLL
jgi:hypothetical protein